jgi:hypothetical protein
VVAVVEEAEQLLDSRRRRGVAQALREPRAALCDALRRPQPPLLGKQQLPGRPHVARVQVHGRALVEGIEEPDRLDLVVEELQAHRPVVARGVQVDDAAAVCELARHLHEPGLAIPRLQEARDESFQRPALAHRDGELHAVELRHSGELLQQGARRGHHAARGRVACRMEGLDARTHQGRVQLGLLVRQDLPLGEELHRLRRDGTVGRQKEAQVRGQGVGLIRRLYHAHQVSPQARDQLRQQLCPAAVEGAAELHPCR